MQTAHLDPSPSLPVALPRFSAVLHGGADAADSLLATAGPGTRVVRVGNPLRAPLTVERILIQSGQMEAGLLTDDAAEQALHRLCHRRNGEARVLLAIDQAETLSPAALRILVRVAAPSGPPRPPQGGLQADLHVVFIGTPAFATLLAAPGLEPLRDALPHLAVQPGGAPMLDVSQSPTPPILSDPAGARPLVVADPISSTPVQPMGLMPQPTPAPAHPAPVAADIGPLSSPPLGSAPPADTAIPAPPPAALSKHLAMMADVMPSRTEPGDIAMQPAASPRSAEAAAAPSILPAGRPAPRRGRSRMLVTLLLVAVIGASAFLVATRPDVQERLGIESFVGQLLDAVRRLRV